VIITTDKVYENKEADYAYKETDKLGGYDPYSASKAAAEIVVSSYQNSFFNKNDFDKHKKGIATARAGNVIGGGDWSEDRIVPDIMRALQSGQPVVVRNPNAIRPWQHVLESLSGYLLLGGKLSSNPVKFANAWNFGPNNDDVLTVIQVVKEAIEVFGSGEFTIAAAEFQPHEAGLLKLDIDKSLHELGWKPKLNSRETIYNTIKGYKELMAYKPRVLVDFIEFYYNLR
jgi:CDP-glucose 4,6-dehydratase